MPVLSTPKISQFLKNSWVPHKSVSSTQERQFLLNLPGELVRRLCRTDEFVLNWAILGLKKSGPCVELTSWSFELMGMWNWRFEETCRTDGCLEQSGTLYFSINSNAVDWELFLGDGARWSASWNRAHEIEFCALPTCWRLGPDSFRWTKRKNCT